MDSRIIHGPWTPRPDLPPMSMSQFRSQVREHLTSITAFERSLQDIDAVLTHYQGHQGRLSFSYSDTVARTLASFREAVEHLRLFLEDTDQLPLVLSALSYSFLSPLLALESQARSLTTLVEDLCLAPSLRPHDLPFLAQRATWTSETLLQGVQRLPLTIDALLDRAAFHEAQLIAIAQGQSTSAWQS